MSLRISDANVLSLISGSEKIPTGEPGNRVITPNQLATYIRFRRDIVQIPLGIVGNNQTVTGSFSMPRGFVLITINTSASMRVRLYMSADARDADINRPLGADKPSDGAMYLEFYSVAGLLDAVLSPPVIGFTFDDGELYYSVQNRSLADRDMTMSFLFLPIEV